MKQHTIGKQLTIPQIKGMLGTTRISIGLLGETLVARALEKTGYQVSIPHERGDLSVTTNDGQILGIEVKTSRRGKDGAYRFTLWKHWQGRQCADHNNADVIILLCVSKSGEAIPYVMPVSACKNKHAVAITSQPELYKGWLSPYKQTIKQLHLEIN